MIESWQTRRKVKKERKKQRLHEKCFIFFLLFIFHHISVVYVLDTFATFFFILLRWFDCLNRIYLNSVFEHCFTFYDFHFFHTPAEQRMK